MKILFVDDGEHRAKDFRERNWTHELEFAFSFASGMAALLATELKGPYDLICLDHDLAEEHYEKDNKDASGTALVAWIIEHTELFKKTTFFIHSLNPVGSARMESMLAGAGLIVQRTPWIWMKEIK